MIEDRNKELTQAKASRYQVFCDGGLLEASGNVALVHVMEDGAQSRGCTASDASLVNCEVYRTLESELIRVEVYHNNSRVRLCIHGLLAAAANLMRTEALSRVLIEHDLGVLPCDLQRTFLGLEEEPVMLLSMALPSVLLQPSPIPGWLSERQNTFLVAACSASSDEEGYLVVECNSGVDVRDLPMYQTDWAPENRRAVIYTVLRSLEENSERAIIDFRYFAPQYGNPEDAATGSAARVLASHYADRYVGLVLHQKSLEGGIMETTLDADGHTTNIKGYVKHEAL